MCYLYEKAFQERLYVEFQGILQWQSRASHTSVEASVEVVYNIARCLVCLKPLHFLHLKVSRITILDFFSRPANSFKGEKALRYCGRFPFIQKLQNFRKGGKQCGNFLDKFLENPKIVEFQNANHSTENFRNYRRKPKWDGNFR